MAVLVVSSGIALLLIVVSILLVHISSAVETVQIRRRLERSECLVLKILTSGSITMGIYLCLQAGVFLVVCWVGVTNELANMWYISGYTFAIAFIGHVLALGSSLCYFLLSEKMSSNVIVGPGERFEYEKPLPLLNENSTSNLEAGIVGVHVGGKVNTKSFSSDTKPTSITATIDTVNILLHCSSEVGMEHIPVTGSKWHFESTFKSHWTYVEILVYLILLLSTTVCTVCTLYNTRDDLVYNPIPPDLSSTATVKNLVMILCLAVIIIGTFYSFVFSSKYTYHVLCFSFATTSSIFFELMCKSDCYSLTSCFLVVGVVSVTLTVWHMIAEEVKCYSLQKSTNDKNFSVLTLACSHS